MFGIDQALSSRYMTPALMAWAALFILMCNGITKVEHWSRGNAWGVALGITAMMLPLQLTALKPQRAKLFERQVAALALELRVPDAPQIGHVFPSTPWALELSEKPVARNLSVFGHPLLANVGEQIGEPLLDASTSDGECYGHLDQLAEVPGSEFLRVSGWIFDFGRASVPEFAWIVTGNGNAVGYVLTGYPRPDVGTAIDQRAHDAGFKGYLLTASSLSPLTLRIPQSCSVDVVVPGRI